MRNALDWETQGLHARCPGWVLRFGLAPVRNDSFVQPLRSSGGAEATDHTALALSPCLSCGMRLQGEAKTWKKSNEGVSQRQGLQHSADLPAVGQRDLSSISR